MEMISLFFNQEARMLGEMATESGALLRVVLSADGEREIGDAVSLWQTEGVPFHRALSDVVYQESVSVRDSAFLEAVRQWATAMRYQLLTLSPEILECWQLMSRLPLEPVQRYSMLISLRALDPKDRHDWKQALGEAANAVRAEQDKTIGQLRATH